MKLFFIMVLVILVSGCTEVDQPHSSSLLKMTVLDVGQGDSIVLQSTNSTMLIDAGTSQSYDEISSYLNSQNIGSIDYVVLSHHHADHYGSMVPILTDYQIGEFWDTSSYYSTSGYEKVTRTISEENIPYYEKQYGNSIIFDKDITIEILNPSTTHSNPNSDSIVLLITAGSQKFLLMGDAENEEEFHIDCDVLKVGHHGSSNANSEKFLSYATPSISVISVGADNSYGLPDPETVSLLDFYGDVYSTTSGTISISTDGTSSWVSHQG